MPEQPLRVGDPVPSETFEQVLLDSERLRRERNDWMQEAAQLKARVENLLAHNAEHRAQVDDLQAWNERLETDRDALKARVDLLTTALTECAEKLESLAGIDIGGQLVAHHARAVLTATPTESEAP